ncbi:MAG: MFS transporter [Alphaproteobacteria bacterium]|nr:MFS transporter [Alphaproteobacteria bacterium]
MPAAVWMVVVAGALVVSIGMGVRQTFGLFLSPMAVDLGFGRETFGFALAIQQIMWGAFQPVMGAVADRYGSGRVVVIGLVGYVIGLLVMSETAASWHLQLGVGYLVGFALSGTTFAVVLGAVGRVVAPEKRGLAFGLATAGGSFGQFIMAPVGQQLIAWAGWRESLLIMAFFIALTLPLAYALRGRAAALPAGQREQTLTEAVREAAGHSGFWYLTLGFFVCGFQVVFIAVHLPAYVGDLGLPAAVGAMALALIGFFNIIGSWGCGVLGNKRSKKYLLSLLYVLRSVVTVAFLFAPKTDWVIYAFASAMGLLWLGTVPLTSGLVAQIFGVRYMATLFGIVFFSHQVGSFLGAWLGGRLFDMTGSYDLMWWISVALGIAAGILHLPIADKPVERLKVQPA